MKVLILADATSAHTIRWVNSIHAKGVEIVLVSILQPRDGDYPATIPVKWLGLKILPDSSATILKMNYLRLYHLAKSAIKSFKPDVVHAYYASSYGLIAALVRFNPTIISVWGSDIFEFPERSFLTRLILQYNLSRVQLLQCPSKVTLNRIKEYSNTKSVIIPFGIDTALFKPQKTVKETIVIGTVKWMKEIYGISVLIKAFKIVKDSFPEKDLKLLLVGSGSQMQEYQDLSRELGIAEYVDFAGFVPHSETPDYFNRMDIFVALSFSESFGVAVLEAAACGIPSVVSRVGGLPEVVMENATGFLVEPGNPQMAADAISKLVRDAQLLSKFSKNAIRFVEQNFIWDHNVESQIGVYQELIAERKP